eukprot:Ihof_evm10s15 gene=Ihof_evmTU10s15
MSEYKQEQEEEMEALESIYPEEYKELSRDPMEFQITIRPDEVEADDINNQDERLILKFELPRNYPDVVPIVTLFGPGLDEPTVDKAKAYLMEKAEENIGMVMCFLLASEAKEWLDARRKTLQEEMDAIDIDKLRLKAEEEAKFAGTPVTRENFVEWRDNFEKEIQGGVAGKATKDSNKAVKKTGRQMFETDKTMMVSDYGLMEE